MWPNEKNYFSGGFSTPPATWKSRPQNSPAMPISERKIISPVNRGDIFHVVHKVPSGDSPYVRAKHVQLVDKDPGRAISLFWAAINEGDRVDSALKDMAVVMKQLNRSDEAIEAVKSFRHLCPNDSQESLDNVLIELYKRSGRVEEEIEMLQQKLKNMEEGIAFGGKKTKMARSQGKKIYITIEQEKSRILGNLAWAYLQQHNYGIAEQYYRKALVLEPDKNKQCNLAICLMHMNRTAEAKSLLQSVRASCGNKTMDEPYAKSYERALEMLAAFESKSISTQRSSPLPTFGNGMSQKTVYIKENTQSTNTLPIFSETWRDNSCAKSLYDSPAFGNRIKGSESFCMTEKKACASSNQQVLYTQPRRSSWAFGNNGDERKGKWGRDLGGSSSRRLVFEQDHNSENVVQPHDSNKNPNGKPKISVPSETSGPYWRSWRDVAEQNDKKGPEKIGNFMEIDYCGNRKSATDDKIFSRNKVKKSWADMAEEEEEEEEEEFKDENLNSNLMYNDEVEILSQKLEPFEIKDGYDSSEARNQTARRSLCFNQHHLISEPMEHLYGSPLPNKTLAATTNESRTNSGKLRNRLQVFQNITP